jgi:hypothetical protein
MKRYIEVFSSTDEVVFHPERFFSSAKLDGLKPYQFFAGECLEVVVEVPHECDCEYCDHTESHAFHGKDLAEIKKQVAGEGFSMSDASKPKPVFFARAVHQEAPVLEIA